MISALSGRLSVLDRTYNAIDCTRACIFNFYGRKCAWSYYMDYMCAWVHMLQNWSNFVKYDFLDLRVSFPMTPRTLQSELYNSRYNRFGGTCRVQIIARLKFAGNTPWTVLSPIINGMSPRCTLTTCKTLKHQN